MIVRAKSALGLKYLEINRALDSQGLSGGRRRCRSRRPTRTRSSIDQVLSMFDGPTRSGDPPEPGRVRRRPRRPRAADQRGDRAAAAAARADSSRWRGTSPRSKTGLARFFRAAGNAGGGGRPRRRRPRPTCSSSLDTTFGAFASVARPFIQDTITETPPTFDTLIQTSPRISTFLRHNAALFADLRPGVHALNENSPRDRRGARDRCAGPPRTPRRSTPSSRPPRTVAGAVRDRTPTSRAGSRARPRPSTTCHPTLQFVTPAQSVCNYATLLFRNAAEPAQRRGDGIGTGQRFLVMSSPGRTEQRDEPVVRTRQQGRKRDQTGAGIRRPRTSSTRTPTRTPPRRASPRECEAGNEHYIHRARS